jgi:IS30 family transposase
MARVSPQLQHDWLLQSGNRGRARRQRRPLLERVVNLAGFVVERLNENWTPEQIAGWLKAGCEKVLPFISQKAITPGFTHPQGGPRSSGGFFHAAGRDESFRPARIAKSLIKDRSSIHERADGAANAIIELFRQFNSELRRSITFDNGGEFARHSLLRQTLNMATWFCNADASWQKGAVENMNGRLRRDLPRKINLHDMSDEYFYSQPRT